MTTLSDWLPFFGNLHRPNFGDVHPKYGTPAFELEYLWSTTLKEFHYRLLDTLTGQFEMLNVLITGHPGIGKTSFLYYLRHRFESESNGRHILHIFHSNHASGHANDAAMEERIQQEIMEAWGALYKACNHSATFDQIVAANESTFHPPRLKKTINELSDYYKRNKKHFPKILIFAVDDVDLLGKDDLLKIVKFVISNIEIKSVKKWFFVRPQTYLEYDEQTKEFLQGFFPDVRQLPRTRLFDLIEHRIKVASEGVNFKNPFSPHLCNYVEEIVGGNLRRSLPVLEHILCEVPVPKEGQSEEFVRNYVDRSAIKSLVGQKLIPDLHAPEFRTIPYPLPMDIVQFLLFTADGAILKACVDDALRQRYMKTQIASPPRRAGAKNGKSMRAPYARDVDLAFSLDKLHKVQLLERTGGAIRLTALGKVVSIFANQPYFLQESMAVIQGQNIYFDEHYVELASVKIDHESIAQQYIFRRF